MPRELALHLPAEHLGRRAALFEQAAAGHADITWEAPAPTLFLDDLRCLRLHLRGSGEHVRAPFAFPFVRTEGFNLLTPSPPLHALHGVDWLVLGGTDEDVRKTLGLALEARAGEGGRALLRVRPYERVQGPLSQAPRPGDVSVTLDKNTRNFNQPGWSARMRQLLELPEERWKELGLANTSDYSHILDPLLDRLVLRRPKLVVDLGCGLGQTTRSLARRYPEARVVGLDSSAEAIAVASRTYAQPNLHFAQRDFSMPLTFAPGSVDLLVSINALPYAQDQQGTAQELFGLLAPDGVLLNLCRTEEAHHFWDFPMSLLLPTNTQLFLADWLEAARQSGRGTEVQQVPLDMSPDFFVGRKDQAFVDRLRGHADQHRLDPPGPFVPWASHVLLAHAAQARPMAAEALAQTHNHLERVALVLGCVQQAPREVLAAAVQGWLCVAALLDLTPEAADFFEALLPDQAGLFRTVFQPALSARQAARQKARQAAQG